MLIGAVGALLATLACAVVTVGGSVARYRPAALVVFALGWGAALYAAAPARLHEHAVVLVIALVVGGAASLGAAHLLRGHEAWVFVAGGATLPIRLPVPVGDSSFNLLVPLYGVVALLLGRMLLDARWDAAPVAPAQAPGATRVRTALDVSIVAMLAAMSVSLLWTLDPQAGIAKVALFFLPFSLLYLAVRDAPAGTIANAGRALGLVMAAAAAIGLYQFATRTIWQNPKLEVANLYTPDFRVNSIFWDPNIYGRYLVVALAAVVVAIIGSRWNTTLRTAAPLAAAAVLLTAGLWVSFSQSSFLSLGVAMVVVAASLMVRRERVVFGVAIAIAAVALLASPGATNRLSHVNQQGRDKPGRAGIGIARDHPLVGVGIGGFEKEYTIRLHHDHSRVGRLPKLRSSHTTPITIAAEQGVLGLAPYLALLLSALLAAAIVARGWLAAAPTTTARVATWGAAAFAAVTAHSMLYAGFFEDPVVWVALGALAAGAGAATRQHS
jgi:O-antigen ligase